MWLESTDLNGVRKEIFSRLNDAVQEYGYILVADEDDHEVVEFWGSLSVAYGERRGESYANTSSAYGTKAGLRLQLSAHSGEKTTWDDCSLVWTNPATILSSGEITSETLRESALRNVLDIVPGLFALPGGETGRVIGQKVWGTKVATRIESISINEDTALVHGKNFGFADDWTKCLSIRDGEQQWSVEARLEGTYVQIGSVVILSSGHTVAAHNSIDGSLKWSKDADDLGLEPERHEGITIYPSSIGCIVVCPRSPFVSLGKEDGEAVWSRKIAGYPNLSSHNDNHLFFLSEDGIEAIDPKTGAALWSWTASRADKETWRYYPPGFKSGKSIATDSSIFFTNYGNLVAFDLASRRPKWIFSAGGLSSARPLVYEGMVFVRDSNFVYALDAEDGRGIWRTRIVSGHAVNPYPFAIAGGRLFLPTQLQRLFVVDAANGNVMQVIPGSFDSVEPVVGADYIIAGGNGGVARFELDLRNR